MPVGSRMVVCSLAVALMATACQPSDEAAWKDFRARFVSSEGRVIDTGNQDISHSEGQGYGMLFAERFGDRPTFDRIWGWTRSHLQVRPDKLLVWKWTPKEGITDRNDATDADLIVAWALLRAGERWARPELREEGMAIAQDIRTHLVKRQGELAYLLPAAQWFEHPDGDVVNLSYWVFPALRDLAGIDPTGGWAQVAETGKVLLRKARFGRWGLPPDWLKLTATPSIAPDTKPRFGYDAVRIPLYLLWGGETAADLLQPFRSYWGFFKGWPFLPDWTDLAENSLDSYPASPGIRAIAQATLDPASAPPAWDPKQDYYSASLSMLTRLSRAERAGR